MQVRVHKAQSNGQITQTQTFEKKHTDTKQTDSKQTEGKQTEGKEAQSKETESKQTEGKQTEGKQTESKAESKETKRYVFSRAFTPPLSLPIVFTLCGVPSSVSSVKKR